MIARQVQSECVYDLLPYRELCTRHLHSDNSLRQVRNKKKQMFHFNLDKASSHRLRDINAIATELRTSALALLRSVKRSTALCTEDNLA